MQKTQHRATLKTVGCYPLTLLEYSNFLALAYRSRGLCGRLRFVVVTASREAGKWQAINLAEVVPGSNLKNFVKRVLPGPSSWWTGWKNRRLFEQHHGPLRREVAARLFGRSTRPAVLGGPFAGMAYINDTVWGTITPKWIGAYDRELWPIWHTAAAGGYGAFVDVGCAEGYYSVGLARLMAR